MGGVGGVSLGVGSCWLVGEGVGGGEEKKGGKASEREDNTLLHKDKDLPRHTGILLFCWCFPLFTTDMGQEWPAASS